MVIDFRNPTITKYNYSIVGNKNYDNILFFTHLINAQDYDTYLKFENDEYVDKVKIPDEDIEVDSENEVIKIKWTMTQPATMSKKLKVQLSFEKEANNETTLIAQSRVVELSLGNTIDVDGDIPIIYPTIIKQILQDIKDLQDKSVASMGVAYESDTLMIDLYNAKHEHLGTQLQVSIPTSLSINNVSYNAGVFTFTHNNGTTDSVDLKDTFYTEDEVDDFIKGLRDDLNSHIDDKNNPHEVTKAQVGLGNVDNKSEATIKQDFTGAIASDNDNFVKGGEVYTALGTKVDKTTKINEHPLSGDVTITKGDVGLENVDNTSDLDKPVSTATQEALDDKVDKVEGKQLSTEDFTTADKTKLEGIEEGAQVNVLEGVKVNNQPLTPTAKVVNIDLSAYALNSDMRTYAKSLVVTIDSSTYIMTLTLKDADDNVLSTQTIDLPLETMVVGGSYDDATKSLILTLKNGQIITIPVSDLVAGLVSETQLNTILLDYYTKSQTDTYNVIDANSDDYVLTADDLVKASKTKCVFKLTMFDIFYKLGAYLGGGNVLYYEFVKIKRSITGASQLAGKTIGYDYEAIVVNSQDGTWEVASDIAELPDVDRVDALITQALSNYYNRTYIDNALSGKQDTMTAITTSEWNTMIGD